MKVSCQLCGTKFDVERNNYRCPECAAHYHVDGETREKDEILDFDYEEDDDEDDYELNQEMVDFYRQLREDKAVKDAKTKKRVKTVVITIEIIIIAFFILMPFLGKGYSKLRFEEQRIEERPPVVEVFINKPIEVGDYGIIVTDCYIDNSARWKLPENYVVYAVEYQTEKRDDDFTGESHRIQSLYRTVNVYLETETGPTIAPIDRYDASELMVYDEYKMVEDRLESYIRYDGGILYFVMKDYEEIYGLCFDYYTGKDDDEHYKELDKIYLMFVPQWEVK